MAERKGLNVTQVINKYVKNPCYGLGDCPYSKELIEMFPLSKKEDRYRCILTGEHHCPVYYLLVPMLQNNSDFRNWGEKELDLALENLRDDSLPDEHKDALLRGEIDPI